MAHVAILGASGKLGLQLVNRALDLGHWVNAFVRETHKLKRQNELLTVYAGDATTGDGLAAALEGCPYVISALDPGGGAMTRFVSQLTKELEGKRVRRLVFISRLGVGDSAGQSRQASGLIMPWAASTLKKAELEDFARAEGVLRVSRLPYLILRTTRLTDDPPGAKVVTTEAKDPPPSRVGRADLSRFIFDELQHEGFDRKELTVGAERRKAG